MFYLIKLVDTHFGRTREQTNRVTGKGGGCQDWDRNAKVIWLYESINFISNNLYEDLGGFR